MSANDGARRKDDELAWVWSLNIAGSALVLMGALTLLFLSAAFGISEFRSDLDDDSKGWVAALVLVWVIVCVPIAIATAVSLLLAIKRNRAAFVLNIAIGALTFFTLVSLILVVTGMAGLTTTARRPTSTHT